MSSMDKVKSDIQICLAKTCADFEDVFKLVYKKYRECGYIKENSTQMHVTLWNLLPQSYTVIARRDSDIVGTVTCVIDSSAGLLLDEIAGIQLISLRQEGRKICEISADVSIDKDIESKTVLNMYRYAYCLAINFLEVTDFVIAVNPRHESFFKRIFLFEQIAGVQPYKKVQNSPAVSLRLNLYQDENIHGQKYENCSQYQNMRHFFTNDQNESLKKRIRFELESRNKNVSSQMLLTLLKRHHIDILNNFLNHKFFEKEWNAFNQD